MGMITSWVSTAQDQLDGVAAGIFGNIVSSSGTLIAAMATLALVLLGVNLVAQIRPMSASQALWVAVKLLLIGGIGLNWGEFSKIYEVITKATEAIGGAMLSEYSADQSLSVAADALLQGISDAANAALEPLGWTAGAFMSVVMTVGLGALGAGISMALIFASVMLTVYISIAPIFIAMSMFEATKDFFNRWLQGACTYALYPIVVAGVLGGIVRVVNGYMATLSTGDAAASVAGFIPFISILVMMIAIVILIPSIVSTISGTIQVHGPFSPMMRTINMMANSNRIIASALQKIAGKPENKPASLGQPMSPANTVGQTSLASRIAARSARFR